MMRNYIIASILLFFCFGFSSPHIGVIARKNAGGACDQAKDVCAGNEDTQITVGESPAKYRAVQFYAQASTTICAADLIMKKNNSPTFNMTVEIWSNNDVSADSIDGTDATLDDDLPSAIVASGVASGSVAASGIGATYETVSFTDITGAITANNFYWLVIIVDNVGDGTDHMIWGVEASGCDGSPINAELRSDDDGISWADLSNTIATEFQLYSE